MVHACPCCRLRFASNGELADHVRTDHTEQRAEERSTVAVVRPHFPAASSRRAGRHAQPT